MDWLGELMAGVLDSIDPRWLAVFFLVAYIVAAYIVAGILVEHAVGM